MQYILTWNNANLVTQFENWDVTQVRLHDICDVGTYVLPLNRKTITKRTNDHRRTTAKHILIENNKSISWLEHYALQDWTIKSINGAINWNIFWNAVTLWKKLLTHLIKSFSQASVGCKTSEVTRWYSLGSKFRNKNQNFKECNSVVIKLL